MPATPVPTESQATVPRPRETGQAGTRPHVRHTSHEYWDLERCRWVPCPTRSAS